MTPGYPSKLERDQVSPSVASLVAVCAAPLGRARGIRPLLPGRHGRVLDAVLVARDERSRRLAVEDVLAFGVEDPLIA